MDRTEYFGKLLAVLDWNREKHETNPDSSRYLDRKDWVKDPGYVKRHWLPQESQCGLPSAMIEPILKMESNVAPGSQDAVDMHDSFSLEEERRIHEHYIHHRKILDGTDATG